MAGGPGAPPPAWAAVVVNHDAGPLLGECIDSLLADDSAGRPEIVVVDNASADDSLAAARGRAGVVVVEPGANLGYARAANLGIATTTAPVVAVCNPDTVLAPGSARAVLDAFAADPSLAVVGPRILNPDGSTYPSARTHPGAGAAVGHALLGRIRPDNPATRAYRQTDRDPSVARDVDWVSGAAVWFARGWLDRVGGWDERYFLFLEDVDVCREIGRAGGRIRYLPSAQVTHVVGASRAARPYRSILAHHRAAYRYADKWWTGARRAALPLAAAGLALRAGAEAAATAVAARRPPRPEPAPVSK